jgi:hypothetical protein
VSWTQERARVAALSRDRESDDPELITARQRLKGARLVDHVERAASELPPPILTPAQRDAILAAFAGFKVV